MGARMEGMKGLDKRDHFVVEDAGSIRESREGFGGFGSSVSQQKDGYLGRSAISGDDLDGDSAPLENGL